VPTEGGSQLKVMEAGVNANAMKYNEIKLTADRKIIELQQRQTVLDSLNLEVRPWASARGGGGLSAVLIVFFLAHPSPLAPPCRTKL
jgi:hypothetical protein